MSNPSIREAPTSRPSAGGGVVTVQTRAELSTCVGIAALAWLVFALVNIADLFLGIWHLFCVGSVMQCELMAVVGGGPLTVIATALALLGPLGLSILLMELLYPRAQMLRDRAARERGAKLEP